MLSQVVLSVWEYTLPEIANSRTEMRSRKKLCVMMIESGVPRRPNAETLRGELPFLGVRQSDASAGCRTPEIHRGRCPTENYVGPVAKRSTAEGCVLLGLGGWPVLSMGFCSLSLAVQIGFPPRRAGIGRKLISTGFLRTSRAARGGAVWEMFDNAPAVRSLTPPRSTRA